MRDKTNGREVLPDEAAGLVADEVALTRLAHTVISVSDTERKLFQDHGVAHVVRLGHAVEVTPTPARSQPAAGFCFWVPFTTTTRPTPTPCAGSQTPCCRSSASASATKTCA